MSRRTRKPRPVEPQPAPSSAPGSRRRLIAAIASVALLAGAGLVLVSRWQRAGSERLPQPPILSALVVTNNGGAVEVRRNTGGNAGNSIAIRVVGTRSNRDGLGTRLTVTAGGRTQVREIKSGSSYLGQNDLRAHVGLGQTARVDRIDVRWPAGQTESIRDVAANQIVTVTEGQGITGRAEFAR